MALLVVVLTAYIGSIFLNWLLCVKLLHLGFFSWAVSICRNLWQSLDLKTLKRSGGRLALSFLGCKILHCRCLIIYAGCLACMSLYVHVLLSVLNVVTGFCLLVQLTWLNEVYKVKFQPPIRWPNTRLRTCAWRAFVSALSFIQFTQSVLPIIYIFVVAVSFSICSFAWV